MAIQRLDAQIIMDRALRLIADMERIERLCTPLPHCKGQRVSMFDYRFPDVMAKIELEKEHECRSE